MTLPVIRRRSDVDVFSSSDLHLSRLSSSRFLSLSRSPFFSIRARIPRVDRPSTSSSLTPIDRPTPPRSPEFHPLLSTRHVLSLSLSSPSRPNHRRKNQRIFASSVSFYPIGTRVSVRAFVAYRPILPLSLLHLPSAHVPLLLSPAFLSLSLSLTASPPFRSSLDPVTSLLPCLRVLPESSPPETFFLSPLRIELRGRFDIIEWIFVKEP